MRGGKKEARLYLNDLYSMKIEKTDMPNMRELVARHKSRYHLGAFLARPDMKVLDFPCGSGYGCEIIRNVDYHGMDNDEVTIEYAKHYYPQAKFYVDDLSNPTKIGKDYDLILCIDGPEHVHLQYQEQLIWSFYDALKPGGTLLVSMPKTEKSGPSAINPYHLGELTFDDFVKLLYEFDSVQIISHEDTLHNGVKSNCLYGIAKKGE